MREKWSTVRTAGSFLKKRKLDVKWQCKLHSRIIVAMSYHTEHKYDYARRKFSPTKYARGVSLMSDSTIESKYQSVNQSPEVY